jgi:hypothetical protein
MSSPAAGRMAWAQALAGCLDGVTCLWQDLDGLHVDLAPADPPPTSVLWGWGEDEHLVRVRLDDGTAFVAVHAAGPAGPGASGTAVLPWGAGDHRVDASQGRGPAADACGVGAAYEQIVVDGIDDGVGPVTFLRPVRAARARQPADGRA